MKSTCCWFFPNFTRPKDGPDRKWAFLWSKKRKERDPLFRCTQEREREEEQQQASSSFVHRQRQRQTQREREINKIDFSAFRFSIYLAVFHLLYIRCSLKCFIDIFSLWSFLHFPHELSIIQSFLLKRLITSNQRTHFNCKSLIPFNIRSDLLRIYVLSFTV